MTIPCAGRRSELAVGDDGILASLGLARRG